MVTSTDIPQYRSHKTVRAIKIMALQINASGQAMIAPEGVEHASFHVNAEYVKKHNPKAGGYYVRYEDGYESWSPAEAFESDGAVLDIAVRFRRGSDLHSGVEGRG